MKIGPTQIVLGEWSLDDTLTMCQEAGYNALELMFAADGDPDIAMSDDELLAVRKKCDGADVEVTSCITRSANPGNLLSRNTANRELGKKDLVRAIEIAHVIKAGAVLLHPGQLTPEGTYNEAWDGMLGVIREIAPLAESKQVAVGIENVWNKFLLSPREMVEFIDTVDSPWIGAYLDTANMMLYGFPEHWIPGLGQRIKRVHFKDFVRKDHQFVPLMDGDTDWPTVMQQLRTIGYDSSLIHEVSGDRELQIEMAKRMKKIMLASHL